MINKRYNRSVSRLAQRNNKLKKVKIGIALIIPVIFLLGLSYVSKLPSLQVSSVEVSGEKSIAKDDITNAILESISGNKLFIFPRTNIFLINESVIATVLASEFPRIENVNVEKNANGVLKVEIKERDTIAIWCNESSCFLLDSMGLLYSKVNNDLESFGKIIFRGAIEGEPLRKYFQDEFRINFYLEAVALLKSKDIKASSINIQSVDKGVIETNIGNIFIDPNTKELLESIENALLVIEDIKSKNSQIKFDYIDTRFGNKIFYK